MKFIFPVVLLLAAATAPSLGQSLKATAAAAESIQDAAGAGHSTDRGSAPDWKTSYDEYVKYVDPDDLGFVIKLKSEGTRHTERGEDYGFMCRGNKCEKDDWLVTNHINNNEEKFRFEYIPHPSRSGAGQIKVKTRDLCFAQDDKKYYRLHECDQGDKGQLFKGFDPTGNKFILVPYEEDDWCITMLHRPLAKGSDDGEEIKAQRCKKAIKTQTAHWIAQFRPHVIEEIGSKDYDCSKNDRCKECQGNCKSDRHCKSGLKCFQRNDDGWRTARDDKDIHKDPWAPIPGCQGYGKYGRNYCYDPKKDKFSRPVDYQ